jgi:hypothetical protein
VTIRTRHHTQPRPVLEYDYIRLVRIARMERQTNSLRSMTAIDSFKR